MTARADILAGRAVIVVSIQDQIDKQLRIIRGKMRAFSNAMSEIGGDLFRGGIAGTVGSIFPVKAFVDFDDQVRFLRTKVVGSQQDFEKLNKEIRRLGMTTSFSPLEVAKGATLLGQAGFSIPEVMGSLQSVLDLGRGGMVDLSTSANILSNSLRAFGIEAKRSSEIASMFIATARLGTLDIVDLGESLKYSQGTFANLEAPIENVLGLLATLSNSGLKASLAGTSLNSAFQDMAANAEDLQKKLGVVFTEEDFQEPLVILSKLSAALEGMSKPQQITIVKELSNIRSARAIFGTLLIGLDKLEENTEKIRLAAKFNEARTAAIYLDDGLGGVFRRLKSGFEEMLVVFGSTTEGPLTGLGEALKGLTENLSVLAEKYPKMIQWLLAIPVLAVGAGAALLLLSTTLSKLIILLGPILSLNWAVWTGLGIVLSGNIKFAKELGGHLKEIGVIWSKVFTMMNPKVLFTWLSPMSGFFGGLRKELIQTFASTKTPSTGLILHPSSKGASKELTKWASQYNNVHDAVKKTTKEAPKAVSLITRVGKAGKGVYSVFSGVVSLTYNLFSNLWKVTKLTFSLLNVFRRIFFTASGWLMIIEFLILFGDKIPVIKDMLAALGNAFNQAFGVLHQMFGELAKDLSLVGEGIRTLLSGDAESGIQKMKDGFADLGETLRNHLNWAWQAFMKEIEPGIQRIQVFFQGLMEVFRLLGGTIGANFSAWDKHVSGDDENSLINTIKAATDPELMKTSFLMIGSILKDILQAILTIISVIPGGSEAWNATQANLARGINTAVKYSPIGWVESLNKWMTGQDVFKYSDERIAEWDDAAKAAQTRSRSIDKMLSGDLDKAWNEFEERIRNIGVSTFDNTRPSQEQLDSDRFWKDLVRTGRDYANDYLGQAGGYVAQFDLALTDALRKGINYMTDSVKANDTQQQQLEQMRVQTRATVGSFEAARYNRLQTFKTEQLQEKTNDLLQQQNGILGNLDSKANPFVFGS